MKFTIKLFTTLIFSIINVGAVFSQNTVELPTVIPPSPSSAALGKFIDMPVNLNIGVARTEIPIYTIVSGDLTLPVSLSYHGGGIKVNELASQIGLGWALNAGGIINKNAKGADDNVGTIYKRYQDINPSADYLLGLDIIGGGKDTEPDEYSFSINDLSARFYKNKDGKFETIPATSAKIQARFINQKYTFIITDDNGNQYMFGEKEEMFYDYLASTQSQPTRSSRFTTSYLLTSIISASKRDTIKLSYTNTEYYDTKRNISLYYGDLYSSATTKNIPSTTEWIYPLKTDTYYIKILSEIEFKSGKLKFYAGKRNDNEDLKIDSIALFNKPVLQTGFKRLKSWVFNQGYFYSNQSCPVLAEVDAYDRYRLRLDQVNEFDKKMNLVQSYSLEYSNTTLPPIGSFAQDYWGYYNGKDGNQSLVRSRQIIDGGVVKTIGDADREVNPAFTEACALKKIIYPTKGYTTFSYEPNYSTPVDSVKTVDSVGTVVAVTASMTGKLEDKVTQTFTIKNELNKTISMNVLLSKTNLSDVTKRSHVKITDLTSGAVIYDNKNTTNTADFEETRLIDFIVGHSYSAFAEAYGDNSMARIKFYFQAIKIDRTPSLVGGLRIKSIESYDADNKLLLKKVLKYGKNESGSGELVSEQNFQRIDEKKVEERHLTSSLTVCSQTVSKRTLYSGGSVFDLGEVSGCPVIYPEVAEYLSDNAGNSNGKVVYKYKPYKFDYVLASPYYPGGVYSLNSSWKGGELLEQTTYKFESNSYKPVQKVVNSYLLTDLKTITYGLHFGRIWEGTLCNVNNFLINDAYYFEYPINTGIKRLTAATTTNYDANGVQSNITTQAFTYALPEIMSPTQTSTVTSSGKTFTSVNLYPQSMITAGRDPQKVYAKMMVRNIIAPVIEGTKTVGSSSIIQTTEFKDWAIDTLLLPNTVTITKTGFTPEKYLNYNAYNLTCAKIESVAKEKGPKISYKYGYRNQYPIAEFVNADINECYFENFEEDANASATRAHTGSRSNASRAFTVSFTKPNTRAYLISWFEFDGVKWNLKEEVYTGSKSFTSTQTIDDIRVVPADASAKSYTYEPLVGITSEIDQRGNTSYYEYDDAQRLINLKNQDGDIINSYQYNYAGKATESTGVSCTKPVVNSATRVATTYRIDIDFTPSPGSSSSKIIVKNTANGAITEYNNAVSPFRTGILPLGVYKISVISCTPECPQGIESDSIYFSFGYL